MVLEYLPTFAQRKSASSGAVNQHKKAPWHHGTMLRIAKWNDAAARPRQTEHPCPAGMFIVGSEEHCAEPRSWRLEVGHWGPPWQLDRYTWIIMDCLGLS